jgi:serine/threonine-protein kinase
VPGYPADLDEIVLAALQRDRGRRLPSAAHLAWRLEEHALRHGILVGPRTVARYVTQVMPAEPERDEALGIVEPRSSAFDIVSFAQSEPSGSHAMVDDDSFHHDLALLGVPPDARRSEEIPDPLDLPIDMSQEPPISVDDAFDQLLAQDKAARSGAQALALDDFDLETEGDDERPILLLGSPKTKPPVVSMEDSDERAFMKSLERRLSEEDE